MFGKTQKTVLYAGAAKNKNNLRLPNELRQTLNNAEQKGVNELARKAVTTIRKLAK
jgi:hypothetical protein